MRIFDTHAHYDDRAFNEDREELIMSLKDKGVEAVTNIAVSLNSSRVAVEYTKKYDFFYGTVGVHPSDIDEMEQADEIPLLKEMAVANERIVAIGEIGLDYHYDNIDKAVQQKWFAAQMELAKEINLPIVVHSRDAAKDTLDIMRAIKAQDIGGVIHCYSYSKEQARDYLNMGYFFGIGGVLTFKNAKAIKEVVDYVPLSNIVLETDSPYLSPDPFRSKRNDSSRLPYVVAAIADIKGVPVEQVYEETWNNALKLYRIKE